MEYKLIKKAESQQIDLVFSKEEWITAIENAYREEAGKYNVQGFRKGKAPRKVIEQNYGQGVFRETAIDKLFRPAYIKVLKENPDIKPVGHPSLDINEKEDGLEICCTVDVEPKFTLGKYTGLEIKMAKTTVTEKDVNAYLAKIQQSRARQLAADKNYKIKKGDVAVIDFVGSVDGVEFEGGAAKNHELEIGSHSFIDTFEEQLIGAKIGGKLDVNVKFPKEYHAKNLADKPALFKVEIRNILIKELPAIDDNLAKEASEFQTLAEYKKDILNRLEQQAAAETARMNENKLLQTVAEQTKINVPQKMIDSQYKNLMMDFEHRLRHQGLNLDVYINYLGITKEEFEKRQREQAKMGVHSRLVFDAIIEKESLQVSEQEILAEAKRIADETGKKESEYTKSRERLMYIEQELVFAKLIDFLTKKNKFI